MEVLIDTYCVPWGEIKAVTIADGLPPTKQGVWELLALIAFSGGNLSAL